MKEFKPGGKNIVEFNYSTVEAISDDGGIARKGIDLENVAINTGN